MADTADLLRDVFARLDALEQRNDALERDNATLKQQNASLLARVDDQSTRVNTIDQDHGSPLERMSRRWVLRRGMQVAAASVAAGVLLHQDTPNVAAQSFDFVDLRPSHDAYALTAYAHGPTYPTIHATNAGAASAVYAQSYSANGAIEGRSLNVNGSGVWGSGHNGVIGVSSHGGGSGLYGNNTNNVGVLGEGAVGVKGTTSKSNYTAIVGEHTGTVGYGVLGQGKGAGVGVVGRSAGGEGVRGEGTTGMIGVSSHAGSSGVRGTNTNNIGVLGEGAVGIKGTSSKSNYTAIVGEHTGPVGYGVLGQGTGLGIGVVGRNNAGEAMRGEGRIGIYAKSTTTGGYGGVFEGGKAQLRLVPNSTAGKPTSGTHSKGELVLDSAAALWICVVGGTPGVWKQVTVS